MKEAYEEGRSSGQTVIVFDILLATTTMLMMLEYGARRIYPVDDREHAWTLKKYLGHSVMLAGEWQGLRVEGFDLGFLPDEIKNDQILDKDIIFLSTNGTRALHRARGAEALWIANLRNLPEMIPVVAAADTEEIHLLCAGSRGNVSYEDCLAADLLLKMLDLEYFDLNDAARWAYEAVKHLPDPIHSDLLVEALSHARVGQYFLAEGLADVLRIVADFGASRMKAKMIHESLQIV